MNICSSSPLRSSCSYANANMKLLLALTICISCWMVSDIALAAEWPVISFDLTAGTIIQRYSTPMQSLRDKVKSTEVKYSVPVLKPPSKTWEFVLVNLKASEAKTITLAINVTDLYVLGYRDTYQGKYRARFFRDVPQAARNLLFDGATKQEIPFIGSYSDLEKNAQQNRQNIELGVIKLTSSIESIYGKAITSRTEAKFLIIAIQMISEAARFKYIEQKVRYAGDSGSYKPDPKAISLENNWSAISKAYNSIKGNIISPLTLNNPSGGIWEVMWVDDLTPDVALLLNVKSGATVLSWAFQVLAEFISSAVCNDGGETIWLFPNRRELVAPN